MSTQPVETLHLRAIEQRNHLHETTAELKAKIAETRKRLDLRGNVLRHFPAAAMIAAAIGLLSGYGFGGMLTQR